MSKTDGYPRWLQTHSNHDAVGYDDISADSKEIQWKVPFVDRPLKFPDLNRYNERRKNEHDPYGDFY